MFLSDLSGFKNPLFLNFKKSFFLAHPTRPWPIWPMRKSVREHMGKSAIADKINTIVSDKVNYREHSLKHA